MSWVRAKKYSVEDGEVVLYFFRKTISKKAELIGSLGRGEESDHDIDIHLPGIKRTRKNVKKIASLLSAKKHVKTDWGGVYFKDTFFGDIDVFFKGNTKHFK